MLGTSVAGGIICDPIQAVVRLAHYHRRNEALGRFLNQTKTCFDPSRLKPGWRIPNAILFHTGCSTHGNVAMKYEGDRELNLYENAKKQQVKRA